MNYLNTMISEFMRLPYYTMVRMAGDQAIHNKLLYSGMFENMVSCKSLDSMISTIATVPRQDILLNDKQEIVDAHGEVLAIIHQYDRHEDLDKIMERKYAKKI